MSVRTRKFSGVELLLFMVLVFLAYRPTPVFAADSSESTLSKLDSITVVIGTSDIQVLLPFNQQVEYTEAVMHEPERIVIDIKNAWYKSVSSQVDPQDWLFDKLEIFQNLDGLRITINLKYAGPWHDTYWDKKTNTLKVDIHREFTDLHSIAIGEGVTYHQIRQGLAAGPVQIQALEVEVPAYPEGRKLLAEIHHQLLPKSPVSLRSVVRIGGLQGLTKVSNLVKQEHAFAGINGNFFTGSGYPLGLLIQNGEIINAPLYNRTAWGITDDGRMYMSPVSMKAEMTINGQTYAIDSLNRPRESGELVLYTPAYGKSTGSNQWGKELVIKNYRVVAINTNDSAIPADGMVISGHGAEYMALFNKLQVGDPVMVSLKLTPDFLKMGVKEAIGGGPRLVQDGRVSITGQAEQFQPDILSGRAPRTALGITPKNHLLMVVVDGRSGTSIGMTLTELANLMIQLGANQAMNLDGGSSSTLVIRNAVYNSPLKGEIGVNNGLLLFAEPFLK